MPAFTPAVHVDPTAWPAWVLVPAVAAPPLLAASLPPSPTLLNQCLSLALWGVSVLMLSLYRQSSARPWRAGGPVLAALGLMGVSVLFTWLAGALPAEMALANLAVLVCAGAVVHAGAALAREDRAAEVFSVFLFALLVAGLLSAMVAFVQVFAPAWTDGTLVAASGLVRRAVGNLRQPNHLASLLVWSLVALAALQALGRLDRLTAVLLVPLLAGAVVLTGSRTGALDMALLALWGALDKRLPRAARATLLAAPLVYGVGWLLFQQWEALAEAAAVAGGAAPTPPRRGDISSSRFGIWSNTLALIAQQPLRGVGFGEFNLAWTLTEFPGRPVAFFDHVHNLPLHLAVEMGLPLALATVGLLGWALWRAGQRVWPPEGDAGIAARSAWMVVALILVHSLLEYPLWYLYFLLPAAFAFGFALGQASQAEAPAPQREAAAPAMHFEPAGTALGLAMLLAAAVTVVDYMSVVVIYAPPANPAPLAQRVSSGQHSWLFGHHADYAALTTGEPADDAAQRLAMRRAPHHLLDTRLMVAWSRALAERGDVDRARYLAARLREFRNPGADEFFADCERPDGVERAFQCQAPQQHHDWREFTRP
ncbi:lipid A core-O-antigen ligase-like enyme [Burkholderiales bacterium JOSHI_001]|nr:lipid A core-O-antigen ligase-like enyme [Burkholderiales bacterium JOSHI_001]